HAAIEENVRLGRTNVTHRQLITRRARRPPDTTPLRRETIHRISTGLRSRSGRSYARPDSASRASRPLEGHRRAPPRASVERTYACRPLKTTAVVGCIRAGAP